MEKEIVEVLEHVSTIDDVTGVIICDNQGLCLGVRGKASEKHAGLISALAKQVTKFEPDSEPPVLTLENDSSKCIIQTMGKVSAAVFKNNQ